MLASANASFASVCSEAILSTFPKFNSCCGALTRHELGTQLHHWQGQPP